MRRGRSKCGKGQMLRYNVSAAVPGWIQSNSIKGLEAAYYPLDQTIAGKWGVAGHPGLYKSLVSKAVYASCDIYTLQMFSTDHFMATLVNDE